MPPWSSRREHHALCMIQILALAWHCALCISKTYLTLGSIMHCAIPVSPELAREALCILPALSRRSSRARHYAACQPWSSREGASCMMHYALRKSCHPPRGALCTLPAPSRRSSRARHYVLRNPCLAGVYYAKPSCKTTMQDHYARMPNGLA